MKLLRRHLFSIRLYSAAVALLVVALPILLLNQQAVDAFNRFTSRAQENEMVGHARIIGASFTRDVLALPPEARPRARHSYNWHLQQLSPVVEARLRVLDTHGVVLCDSSTNSLVGTSMTNRIEVREAIAGTYGAHWELSDDGKYVYYYVAEPFDYQGQRAGIVHVRRNTGPIIKAIIAMKLRQRRILLYSLLGAGLAILLLTQTMSFRLVRLTRAVRRFGREGNPITTHIHGRDEIGELATAVKQMSHDLVERNAYNRDFVATLTHELKTPLTSIRSAAEVLHSPERGTPEERRRFADNIVSEAQRLNRLASGMHLLTSLDTGLEPGQRRTLDAAAVAADCVDCLALAADAEGRAPLLYEPPASPVTISIVPGQLDQVITNLVENAWRYTPADGTITLDLTSDSHHAILTISDTGSGIAPTNIDRVFDRFFTTSPKSGHGRTGSGIGLAIVKAIVENHGGSVSVQSPPNQGTTFTIRLPLATQP